MSNKVFSRFIVAAAFVLAAVPPVLAAGVVLNSPKGAIDTRRPVLQQTGEGKVDTRAPGFLVIVR